MVNVDDVEQIEAVEDYKEQEDIVLSTSEMDSLKDLLQAVLHNLPEGVPKEERHIDNEKLRLKLELNRNFSAVTRSDFQNFLNTVVDIRTLREGESSLRAENAQLLAENARLKKTKSAA